MLKKGLFFTITSILSISTIFASENTQDIPPNEIYELITENFNNIDSVSGTVSNTISAIMINNDASLNIPYTINIEEDFKLKKDDIGIVHVNGNIQYMDESTEIVEETYEEIHGNRVDFYIKDETDAWTKTTRNYDTDVWRKFLCMEIVPAVLNNAVIYDDDNEYILEATLPVDTLKSILTTLDEKDGSQLELYDLSLNTEMVISKDTGFIKSVSCKLNKEDEDYPSAIKSNGTSMYYDNYEHTIHFTDYNQIDVNIPEEVKMLQDETFKEKTNVSDKEPIEEGQTEVQSTEPVVAEPEQEAMVTTSPEIEETSIYSKEMGKTILFKPYKNIKKNKAIYSETEPDYISISTDNAQLFGKIILHNDEYKYTNENDLKEKLKQIKKEEEQKYSQNGYITDIDSTDIKEGTFKSGERLYAYIGDYKGNDYGEKTCHAIIELNNGYLEVQVQAFANNNVTNDYMIGILNSIYIR